MREHEVNLPLAPLATPLILQAIPVSGANRDSLAQQGVIHRSVSSFQNAYYNEIDLYAAQWLRNLIAAGHIAAGDVDERSIVDVRPDDLRPYRQCHFFAGIGGWSYALRLAGWPDDKPAWTGSCPCQPLSVAGQRKGHVDERHLWPAFHRLIAECQPPVVFGEQVASADGREWLAAVRADLEADGYAVGCADLCAAGVGAPHIRQRLWFVGSAGGLAHSAGNRTARYAREEGDARQSCRTQPSCGGTDSELADAAGSRCGAGWTGEAGDNGTPWLEPSRLRADGMGNSSAAGLQETTIAGGHAFWSNLVWLPCTDGKARPTQSGIFPLAHGVSARVGKLRAAGNAIVPQIAAEFIKCIFKLD